MARHQSFVTFLRALATYEPWPMMTTPSSSLVMETLRPSAKLHWYNYTRSYSLVFAHSNILTYGHDGHDR